MECSLRSSILSPRRRMRKRSYHGCIIFSINKMKLPSLLPRAWQMHLSAEPDDWCPLRAQTLSSFFCVFKENMILIGLWKRYGWRGGGLVDLLSCKRWCFLTLINLVSDLILYLFFKFSESQLSFILPGILSLWFCWNLTFNMQALNFYFLNFLSPEFVRWPPIQHGMNEFHVLRSGIGKMIPKDIFRWESLRLILRKTKVNLLE